MKAKDHMVILSGGMDSTTLLFHTLKELATFGRKVHAISFDYGQRHHKEVWAASKIFQYARGLYPEQAGDHTVVRADVLGSILGGSALTQRDIVVPHGHYTEESMKRTV